MSPPPLLRTLPVGGLSAVSLPLCVHGPGDVVAWTQGRRITRSTFLSHVERAARQLPDGRHAVNLCEDRYLFLVTFCAVLLRGQTNVLPNCRADAAIDECAAQFPDAYRVTNGTMDDFPYTLGSIVDATAARRVPEIPADHVAAVLFTSGTTGDPHPHPQRWSDLLGRAWNTRDRLGVEPHVSILATVPAQHMFGLETSILLPLASGACTDARRPFFPSDVRDALRSLPASRVLVTTPVHLRACLEAHLRWPDVEFLLSATAPMPKSLAARAEASFRGPLLEIYGSTETGAMATRRTATDDLWRLCDGLTLQQSGSQVRIAGHLLPDEFFLQDQVKIAGPGRFRLLGRSCDLVNIAGKRGSLADLTQKLLDIDGVDDGVLVANAEDGGPLERLSGLVVAPNLSKKQVLRALSRRVDPVFLPRPLYRVSRLDRDASGKLPADRIRAQMAVARGYAESGTALETPPL